MASLQERNGSWRVLFCYHGKLHSFTLGKVEKDEAENKAQQIEYLLMRLKQKLLVLPDGIDIVTFVEHDGKPPDLGPTLPDAPRQTVTVGHLRDRYLATYANGTIEASSLDTCKLHLAHFCRTFGDAFPLTELSLVKLQDYVNVRAKAKIAPATIRKEIATLRAAWNWGGAMDLTTGNFPSKGLRYPKAEEKPPFMTMAEIERQVLAGGDADSLWECLYLTAAEVTELLAHVQKKATHPWIYPLFCFAAHTGARRSELMRALVADVDLAGSFVIVREKKRNRSQRTTRRVPLTPFLRDVLKDWLTVHPGGSALFCHTGEVMRSKKRSRTTGHQSGKLRTTSLQGRLASVTKRQQPDLSALTRTEVHDHFKRVLAGTPWEVIHGLHTLRHSFISACASKGVDQRLIDEWVGHATEQQRKRYRHLYPGTQQEAIKSVFDAKSEPAKKK
ncbi:MAG: tyrosine-type recombinase/integrase [Planctomycetia bacterium]|nr:tyrosine-type recombinase/integrase [Planctomycetia bacterium]